MHNASISGQGKIAASSAPEQLQRGMLPLLRLVGFARTKLLYSALFSSFVNVVVIAWLPG